MRVFRPGDAGDAVRDIQHRLLELGARVDAPELAGRFGPSTEAAVRSFQRDRGLPADGIVGPDTWGLLVEAGYRLGDRVLYLRSPAFRGDDVRQLQRRLNALGFDVGKEDGIFGPRTETAVLEFQRNVGEKPDGIVGPDTLEALQRIRQAVEGPSRAIVREAEDVRTMARSLAGSRIAIDPGHGGPDVGNVGPSGMTEARAALMLAVDVAEDLARRGAVPTILRTEDQNPSPAERARAANELGATLCVSLHLNGSEPEGEGEGATCFYYGTGDTYSPAGQRLAEVIQQQLTERLQLMDGRVHPLAVTILRETRMPAVQVEPCFLTNPREEGLVCDPAIRRRLAAAIADGIERFFSSSGAETQTTLAFR